MCYTWGAIRGRIAPAVALAFTILPLVAYRFNGGAVALGCCVILVLLMLRRLEGLPDDARVYGHFWRRVFERLVLDERPGRPLMGPRTDPGVQSLPK
jgi:hypothetical protein